ncbi:hypothetical protein N665_0032s0010 [Sinapis alba]|nr:hypothetical protein N665_0032s0010 [Sinapis alba]
MTRVQWMSDPGVEHLEYTASKLIACKYNSAYCFYCRKVYLEKVSQTLKVMGVDHKTVGKEKSTRVKKLGPALQTPFRGILPNVGNKKQDNQLNLMRGCGYDPVAPVDMQKVKILNDWLQLDKEVIVS